MVSKFITLTLLLCIVGCHSINNESSKDTVENLTTKFKTNDWIKDSQGCLKLRNEKLAYKLIEENNLKNGAKEDFVKVFGIANKIDSTINNVILIYYFDCICIDNKLNVEGDKCYASFHFNNGRLKSEEFICE